MQRVCQQHSFSSSEFIVWFCLQEGFADYLETAVRATRRSQAKQRKVVPDSGVETDEERKASLWQGAFAAGAVAVGAMAAFTLRQAFS